MIFLYIVIAYIAMIFLTVRFLLWLSNNKYKIPTSNILFWSLFWPITLLGVVLIFPAVHFEDWIDKRNS